MSTAKQSRPIKTDELDKKFDDGKSILDAIEPNTIKSKHSMQRLSIDIPKEIIETLDHEAARIGVTRTSLIKVWLSEKLDALKNIHRASY